MTTQEKLEEEIQDTKEEEAGENPKPLPPKPPISRSGPAFPPAHQFHGTKGNNLNNRQRPGRAANRGR